MIKTFNPDFKQDIREKLARQGFMKLTGFNITKIEVGSIEGELTMEDQHLQQMGFAHGGLIATVADIVAGFAAASLVPKGHSVVTAELKVSYLNPGVGEKLWAKGYVIKSGRRLSFCEAEVYVIKEDHEPLLIAKATTTMATITPGDIKRRD
ncbi:PaaI family thioesterase [Pontibacter pamirensis]|uniref:PaaI family thioesterase n=1 Tax=Pontibacter pamirensis TaxID=2562824 RepID=UPI0013894AD0|nr:PaaI family thioesterase [Pontibacter pamirensis]